MLTKNEKKVLRLLAVSMQKHLSINEIARSCDVSPGGAFKILTKLDREHIVHATRIANIKAYSLSLTNEKTSSVLELAFIPDDLKARIKARKDDLQPLKEATLACILFGSYITAKKLPSDLDVLFILDRKKYHTYKHLIRQIQDRIPIKIQDVVQTKNDLKENIKKQDPIVASAIRSGIVLWGFDTLVKVIRLAQG